jgi:hypothetical protein
VLRINDVCGFGCRIKWVASRSTPPLSMTAFARRRSSRVGSLVADCPRPDLPHTRNPPRVVQARPLSPPADGGQAVG